jgi:hypothetical protein
LVSSEIFPTIDNSDKENQKKSQQGFLKGDRRSRWTHWHSESSFPDQLG